jgi:glycosyltransferase involved in cell wall biosynthesis
MQSTSIILSTYNKPDFLRKVLIGYNCQTYSDFDIIIADDGSSKDTKNIIGYFKDNTSLDIKHIWHQDEGFQKSVILNKAIQASKSDYLIFSDGDCIPNQSFIQTHIDLAEKDYFLSGGHFPLSSSVSNLITEDIILSQKCFNKGFLISHGQILSKNYLKLLQTNLSSKFLDIITPTRSTFNGNNTSAWRKDIIKVNGFDQRMKYGGLDCELGERLSNMGIRSKQVRHRSCCLHLYHDRPYKNNISMEKNRLIRYETYTNKSIYTSFGIKK